MSKTNITLTEAEKIILADRILKLVNDGQDVKATRDRNGLVVYALSAERINLNIGASVRR